MAWDSAQGWLDELDADPELEKVVEGALPQSLDAVVGDAGWSSIFCAYLGDKMEARPRAEFLRALVDGTEPFWIYNRFWVDQGNVMQLDRDLERTVSDGHASLEDFAAVRDFVSAWLTEQWLGPFLRRAEEVKGSLEERSLLQGSWLDPSLLRQLKGTPRPDTFAEIEKGEYWWEVFDQWASKCDEGSGWRDQWERFKANPGDRQLREELKPLVKSKDAPFNYSVGQLKQKLG